MCFVTLPSTGLRRRRNCRAGEMLAKIAAWQRLPKLVYIWLMVCMVYFIITRFGSTQEWKDSIQEKTQEGWGLRSKEDSYYPVSSLYENAHRLPSADYFLGHFDLLSRVKGMTMEEAKSGCTWGTYETVNYQYAGDNPWVVTEKKDKELAMRRKEWQKFVRNELIPYEPYRDHFSGQGIVLVGGNELSIKRTMVLLAALKKLNSKIPVELHYWDYEMNDEKKRPLNEMYPYLTYQDLSNKTNIVPTTDHSPLINWQYKTVALINSRFEEVILMDTDNIPALDPAELFQSNTYKEYGTVFWPDIARTRPQNPMWAITNTACRMDEYEQESGQMMVDKRKFWYHLQLASFFDDKHGGYYNEFLLGDKDMFRFTWHALKTKYGKPKKWITSMGTLNGEFFCGHTFAQYHPDNDRVAFLHGGLLKTMTQQTMQFQHDNGGIWQAYKKAPSDEDPSVSVDVTIKWDGAEYLPNRPENLRTAWCTDMYKVKPEPLSDILPNFDETFREIGGYWPLDFPDYP